MTEKRITAILLAGGQGSRMNHQDKAWVQFEGQPLIRHVITHIRNDVEDIVISRNRDQPEYDSLPYPCVSDGLTGHQGPLAGISACLNHVNTDFTLVLPCDVPHLPGNLVARLADSIDDAEISVARSAERLQPLVFVARTSVLDSIGDYLASGKRSVMGWLENTDYKTVEFTDSDGQFENINEITQLR